MSKSSGKKREKLSFYETIKRIKASGLTHRIDQPDFDPEEDIPIDEKVKRIMDFLNRVKEKKLDEMYCFVMYDIEDNRIRNYIAKYLIKNGCIRVQKSVFVANISRKLYLDLSQKLADVNAMYDNCDSIFFLPIGEDVMNNLRMIGKNIDMDIVTNSSNTLFF